MSPTHEDQHPLAGQRAVLRPADDTTSVIAVTVEDWWDRETAMSWHDVWYGPVNSEVADSYVDRVAALGLGSALVKGSTWDDVVLVADEAGVHQVAHTSELFDYAGYITDAAWADTAAIGDPVPDGWLQEDAPCCGELDAQRYGCSRYPHPLGKHLAADGEHVIAVWGGES